MKNKVTEQSLRDVGLWVTVLVAPVLSLMILYFAWWGMISFVQFQLEPISWSTVRAFIVIGLFGSMVSASIYFNSPEDDKPKVWGE